MEQLQYVAKKTSLTSAWWSKNSHDPLACPVRIISPASCTKYPEMGEKRHRRADWEEKASAVVFFLVKHSNDPTAAETVQTLWCIQTHYLLEVFVGPFTNAPFSRSLDFIKIKSVVCDLSKAVTITHIYKCSFTRLHCRSERSYEL